MSMYDTKAWPTRYAGVEFRSRLEARWAAFFDLAKIKWDYEPFDLKGWTPDFLLSGKSHSLLVEIKPTERRDASYDKAIRADLGESPTLVLCAGLSPLVDFGEDEYGYVADRAFGFGQSDGKFFWYLPSRQGLGIAHIQDGCWGNLDGIYWKDPLESLMGYAGAHGIITDLVRALWREAGNIVQWKPRSGR